MLLMVSGGAELFKNDHDESKPQLQSLLAIAASAAAANAQRHREQEQLNQARYDQFQQLSYSLDDNITAKLTILEAKLDTLAEYFIWKEGGVAALNPNNPMVNYTQFALVTFDDHLPPPLNGTNSATGGPSPSHYLWTIPCTIALAAGAMTMSWKANVFY